MKSPERILSLPPTRRYMLCRIPTIIYRPGWSNSGYSVDVYPTQQCRLISLGEMGGFATGSVRFNLTIPVMVVIYQTYITYGKSTHCSAQPDTVAFPVFVATLMEVYIISRLTCYRLLLRFLIHMEFSYIRRACVPIIARMSVRQTAWPY